MMDANALLEQADALLERNQLNEAKRLYAEVAQHAPANADAWMMLGLIEQEQAQPAAAEAHLRRAVELDDQFVEAQLNLANLLRQQGRLDEATHFANLAVKCDEGYTEAWVFLGGVYQSRGMLAEAIAANQRALQLAPDLTDLWLHQGALSLQYGQFQNAVQCYRQVIAQAPTHAEAHNRLGGALMRQAKYAEAETAIRTSLQIDPGYVEAHANLGNLFLEMEQYNRAADCFRQALQINPNFVGALANLGHLAYQQKQFSDAAPYYEKVLQLAPDFTEAHLVLGNIHLELGDAAAAVRCFEEGVRSAPLNPDARISLGYALNELGEQSKANAQFIRALEINPNHAQAHFNQGLTQKALGNYTEAASCFGKALSLEPNNIETQLALSLVSLLLGNLAEGWRHYRARPSMRDKPWSAPDALANDLHGKRFLLVKDQGIGDEIFFLRFAPLLKARGAWIAYRTDPKIASLVARCAFIDQVVGEHEALESIDATLSVGDLPYLLEVNEIDQIPAPIPLPVLADAMDAVQQELKKMGEGPFIGVTWWAGSKQTRADQANLAFREIPLPELADVLRGVQATILILQRNPSREDIEYLRQAVDLPIHDLSYLNNNIEHMLALLSFLDDYIGVDNTNMHLSACVSKPCRILVPHPPEWRAMSESRHSIWFPGFSLYRQSPDSDWSPALQALKSDLAGFAERG
ncbi:MAG: tetratricopeptide repeat protein [Thiobacillus sp.]|uniref:tetratricopeptide repeat protein n=1 Tax=Thiobacillus sp. TaxID=924 RepID=UPI0027334F9C|nr:tetratricopeptide repeat protein [Thiobacillus sp.]MDP3584461.1 tetratricopeptide repeat protein [Thiobacillus sp.]